MKMSEPPPRKTSYREALEKALEAREQFLREQPHLRSFQDEIDRILEKTVGFENRMSVLAFMMEAKLYELKEAVASLHSTAVKVHGLFGNPKA
jgi:hypothetical protein